MKTRLPQLSGLPGGGALSKLVDRCMIVELLDHALHISRATAAR
jgi:hypothetical protein